MRKILITLAAGASLAAPATSFAASKVSAELAPAFSNTIVSTYPDGRTARLWLNRDGSYTAKGRRGKPSGGRWTASGERICLKQTKPFAGPFKYCTRIVAGGVGTSWTGKAVTGEAIKITLVAGR